MKIDTDNILDSILDSISNIEHMRLEDIPNIPLYMDQVTTLMDEKLKASKRYEEDKILTKTMINNYAKNNLLPPPIKKKYDKEHVLVLVFIYYFKNILSIKDIEKLLLPITSNYFQQNTSIDICNIYEEVFSMGQDKIENLKDGLREAYSSSQESFPDSTSPDQEFLQIFSFICMLSFDVYIKKQIIEQLIDSFPFESLVNNNDKKKKNDKQK